MALTSLVPWRRSETDLLRPLQSLQREMNRMMDAWWKDGLETETAAFCPDVELTETDGEVHVSAEIPGMSQKDIDVSLSADHRHLLLRGEKKREREEKKGTMYRSERIFGSFHRVLPLPAEVNPDKVDARYKNGVLDITMKKADEKAGTTHISIKNG